MLKPHIGDGVQQAVVLRLVETLNRQILSEYAQAITSLSSAAERACAPQAQQELVKVAQALKANACGHRALLPPTGRQAMDLGHYIGSLCDTFLVDFLAARGIRLLVRIDDIRLEAERCWKIGLIVTEVIRDACRHRVSRGQGTISIDITRCCGDLCCEIWDDGLAATESFSGNTRRLVELMAAEMGGFAEWMPSSAGGKVQVQIPAGAILSL